MLDQGGGQRPARPTPASASPSSATSCCRPWTSSSCTGGTAARCRSAAPTSGATSPPGCDLIRRVDGASGPRADHAAGHQGRRDASSARPRRGTVWLDPRADLAVRLLPVLAQHRRPRRRHASCGSSPFCDRDGDRGARGRRRGAARGPDGPARAGRGADRPSCTGADGVRAGRRRQRRRCSARATLDELDARRPSTAALREAPHVGVPRDGALPTVADLLVGDRPGRRAAVGGPPRRSRRAAPTSTTSGSTDADAAPTAPDFLHGRSLVLRRGKRGRRRRCERPSAGCTSWSTSTVS